MLGLKKKLFLITCLFKIQNTNTLCHLLFRVCVFLQEQGLHDTQEPETQTPAKCAFCWIMITFTGNPRTSKQGVNPARFASLKQNQNQKCETLFPKNTHTRKQATPNTQTHTRPKHNPRPSKDQKITRILKNILCVPTNPNENVFNSDTNCVFHSFLMLYCF